MTTFDPEANLTSIDFYKLITDPVTAALYVFFPLCPSRKSVRVIWDKMAERKKIRRLGFRRGVRAMPPVKGL